MCSTGAPLSPNRGSSVPSGPEQFHDELVDSKRMLGAEELADGPDGTRVAGLTELSGAFA